MGLKKFLISTRSISERTYLLFSFQGNTEISPPPFSIKERLLSPGKSNSFEYNHETFSSRTVVWQSIKFSKKKKAFFRWFYPVYQKLTSVSTVVLAILILPEQVLLPAVLNIGINPKVGNDQHDKWNDSECERPEPVGDD